MHLDVHEGRWGGIYANSQLRDDAEICLQEQSIDLRSKVIVACVSTWRIGHCPLPGAQYLARREYSLQAANISLAVS